MSADPNPNFNPYSPPTADTDGATWPENSGETDFKMTADRGTRLGAAIIDGLLYLATMIPAIILIALMRGSHMGAVEITVIIVAIGILPLAIYQWYLVATTGQTLAKKWLRIRVVKMDGSPVDFMSGVFLRIWVPSVILHVFGYLIVQLGASTNVANLFGLIDVLLIFGRESRCVHDLIAGTKVVVA